jgi:hypothetical protein
VIAVANATLNVATAATARSLVPVQVAVLDNAAAEATWRVATMRVIGPGPVPPVALTKASSTKLFE